jgi:16S rRNA (guanine527-N7)-methyltransferase
MTPARIAELLEPFVAAADNSRTSPLTGSQLSSISMYVYILLRWNARMNLTAIREPEEIVTRHFGESLFAASRLFPIEGPEGRASSQISTPPNKQGTVASGEVTRKGPSLADVGSGAGFPGVPIKLWAPQISLTLIESNHKKATFLREISRALTLTDIDIQTARAESLPPASFDTVTLRAVERFEAILPTAAGLVAPEGRLALLISQAQLPQARHLLPSLQWLDPQTIPNSRSRILAITKAPLR